MRESGGKAPHIHILSTELSCEVCLMLWPLLRWTEKTPLSLREENGVWEHSPILKNITWLNVTRPFTFCVCERHKGLQFFSDKYCFVNFKYCFTLCVCVCVCSCVCSQMSDSDKYLSDEMRTLCIAITQWSLSAWTHS